MFGTGLALAAVTGVLALTRDRQRQAMPEVERYFTLAPEMVVLGRVRRLLEACESDGRGASRVHRARVRLGARSWSSSIQTTASAARRRHDACSQGATVRAFENRVLCKDGSHKWIEWTVTPVPEERVMYGVGRDVTDRRRSESEQAALQRIATLVAQEAPQADVFGAIAEEIGGLLGTEEIRMLRFDSDTSAVVLGGSGRRGAFPLGSHQHLEGDSVASRVLRTGRPARIRRLPGAGRAARRNCALDRRPRRRRCSCLGGRAPVGRDYHRVDPRQAPATGYRGPSRQVHRSRGHRGREHRASRMEVGAPRVRAGRAAAGGDAGRGRGRAERGAGRGGRGDGAGARRRGGLDAEPLRTGRRGDRGRASGSGPAGDCRWERGSATRART